MTSLALIGLHWSLRFLIGWPIINWKIVNPTECTFSRPSFANWLCSFTTKRIRLSFVSKKTYINDFIWLDGDLWPIRNDFLGVCPTQQCAAVTTQFWAIIVPPHPTRSKWTIQGHEYLSAVFPPTILCSDWPRPVRTSDWPMVLQRSNGGSSGCRLQLNELTVVNVSFLKSKLNIIFKIYLNKKYLYHTLILYQLTICLSLTDHEVE